MKLKRILSLVFSFVVLMNMPMQAVATEMQTPGCSVTAESIRTFPGKTITIPVQIENNPGFNNFAISLEYDTEKLTLISIDIAKEDTPYLCGSLVSSNVDWKNPEKTSCGYIVAESPDAVADNGILFTATFEVSEALTDVTVVAPVVHYIRSNAEKTPEFADIAVTVTESTVTPVKPGDVTGDDMVDYDDVMLIYRASLEEVTLNEEQMVAADFDGNNEIDESDVEAVYDLYRGITI